MSGFVLKEGRMQHQKKIVIGPGKFPTRSDECRMAIQRSFSFYVLWTLPERLGLFHRAEPVVRQVSYMLLILSYSIGLL